MKAVTFNEYGGPEVLSVQEIPVPAIAADEVLIQVAATSFNAVDASIRAGKLKEIFSVAFPAVPGIDVAGIITEVGSSVTNWKPGDWAYGMLPIPHGGCSAEFVAAKASLLAAVPKNIPLQDAATLPGVAITAWQGLFEHINLQPGQRILITGASGSVGAIAVQLAKWKAAYVIATSSRRHVEQVEDLGADEVIDHRKADWQLKIKDKVDAIFNLAPVTPDFLTLLMTYVKPGGIVVSTTLAPDAKALKAAGIKGLRMEARPEEATLQQIAKLVEEGALRPKIRASVNLDELPIVHEQFENGHVHGKVQVVVANLS